MRWLLWLTLGLSLIVVGVLAAEGVEVEQRTAWIVPHDYDGVLRVQPGDVIEVWTQPLPLIPANLESRFRASTEGAGVELVGEALPRKEGTMERLFYFKAFEPGPAALTIELVHRDGTVRETRTYQVEVEAAEPKQ